MNWRRFRISTNWGISSSVGCRPKAEKNREYDSTESMLEGKREFIAKDPQSLILQQGWASVSLDTERWRMELRSLYEHVPKWTRSETLLGRSAA